MGTSAPTLSTDEQWRLFEAACREVGIGAMRLADVDGEMVYDLTDPWQYAHVSVRRAVAIVDRAMNRDEMECHVHCYVANHDNCAMVPVDAVLADPSVKCSAA